MKEKKKYSISFLVSLGLHIALLLFLLTQELRKSEQEKQDLEIEWVELDTLPKDLDKSVQVVQQEDQAINNRTPEKDYKLSKNNQDVDQETKAQKTGEFKNRKNTQESPARKTAKPQPNSHSKQSLLSALKPSLYNDQYAPEKMAPPAEPALTGAEVSQNDDYLKDVVAGAETLLKTREFIYYSYYSRIKKKLRQHWEPRIQEKIIKILRKGRRIASVKDKITHLVITLDKQGTLKKIQVKHASGYNDLDDAAIEAFRAAAPFPNPPQGIVSGGEVKIPWSFVLET